MPFRCEVPVRYGEVDMQGVVFNAHYLAYIDEAMSQWLRSVGYPYGEGDWDFMVRHADLDWRGSATYGDLLQIDCNVDRWGETSFRVHFVLGVGDEVIVDAHLTYVGIDARTKVKQAVPADFRALLDR